MKHLEVVSEFKDLGLLVDSKLSWNIHEHSIVSKANKMLGLISRTCRGFADVKTFKTLHCSFFLSQLEHGSVVWSRYTQQNIDMIEHEQRRATRLILKLEPVRLKINFHFKPPPHKNLLRLKF